MSVAVVVGSMALRLCRTAAIGPCWRMVEVLLEPVCAFSTEDATRHGTRTNLHVKTCFRPAVLGKSCTPTNPVEKIESRPSRPSRPSREMDSNR